MRVCGRNRGAKVGMLLYSMYGAGWGVICRDFFARAVFVVDGGCVDEYSMRAIVSQKSLRCFDTSRYVSGSARKAMLTDILVCSKPRLCFLQLCRHSIAKSSCEAVPMDLHLPMM